LCGIRIWDLSEAQIEGLEKFALSSNEVDLRAGHGLSGSVGLLAPFDGYVTQKKSPKACGSRPANPS
jgi:hypothetical protein